MWPSGRGPVPHAAANPDFQNQQGTILTTPATYPPHSSPNWDSQAPPRALFSQQVSRSSGLSLPQDMMAGGMVPWDQNWPFQNLHRRESVLEYKNGEVVMVKCNQQKSWLYGTIQRMSAQGLWIWMGDANSLVNVPLELVPTHVLKMSMFPELQAGAIWTMAITDNMGFRKALVQCVCPAHLSNRQLLHKFGRSECAICKRIVLPIDMVSPWNCSHQVHNHCLQLRMQHSSTSACPSCTEMRTNQHMPLVPSTSRLMPLPSTSNARISSSNELWLEVQCACGFRGSINSGCIDDMYAPVVCPNCHQPMNVNPMTIGMQYGEQPFASMDLSCTYSEAGREILQRKTVEDRGLGWPMQSFGAPNRLDATAGGSQKGICFTPPPPDREDKERDEPGSYSLVEFEGKSQKNSSDPDVGSVSSVHESMHPSSSARSSLQDGASTAPSPTQITPILKKPSSLRSSSPTPSRLSPGQSRARSRPEDGSLRKPAGQVCPRGSSQDGSLCAAPSSARITPIQDEKDSTDESPTKLPTSPAASTHGNHVKFAEVLELVDESPAEILQTETTTVAAPDRQILSRGENRVDQTRRDFDEDSEDSAEASTSDNFAAIAPSTPPVYVNHFANFLKLAMASPSTAKKIPESADSASASSSITDPPLLEPPTPGPLITPAPTFAKPAPAFAKPAPAYFKEYPAVVIEAPAAVVTPARSVVTPVRPVVTPARAFFSQGPALITNPPDWVTNGAGPASPAWITVIKDGVDSRRDDAKQWELDREVKQKEAKFS